MQSNLIKYVAVLLGLAMAHPPAGKLKLVATIPDLADIAREIGGDRVEVKSICKGTENTHRVVVRPSHLAAVARADVFIQVGLALETAFVPGLLQASRNQKVQPGAEGFINVSQGWQAIGVPEVVDRIHGDIHPQGNPHMNTSPASGRHMAGAIMEGLVRIDPGSEAVYRKRHAAYLEKITAAEERWAQVSAGWTKGKVVLYHLEFNYLLDHYGIEVLGSIELKPGIPPTPRHLSELIGRMKQDRPAAILTAKWSNNRNVDEVSERTGIPVIELPSMAGGDKRSATWIGMMDLVHERLNEVFAPEDPPRTQ